jgi:hypothetical protein
MEEEEMFLFMIYQENNKEIKGEENHCLTEQLRHNHI